MPHGIFLGLIRDWYILSTVSDYFQLLYKFENYVEIEWTEGGYSASSFVLWGICLDKTLSKSQSVGKCYNTVQYPLIPSQQEVH